MDDYDLRGAVKRYGPIVAAIVLVGLWLAVVVLGPTFYVLFLTIAFVGAFALVPLLAYIAGASTPAFIAEPLASLLVSVGIGGVGLAVMEYSDGRYKKRLLKDGESYPEGAYYSVGLGELVFVYDRSDGDLEAWSDDVDVETLRELDESEIVPNKVDAGTTRNGLREFVDTSLSNSHIFVYAAEALSRWQDSASIDDAHIGENKARQEHSKEVSSSNTSIGDRVEWFLLFVTGVTIGFIFFF